MASTFQSAISRNTSCVNKDGFCKSSHIYVCNVFGVIWLICTHGYVFNILDVTISFEKTAYSVDENDEFIQLVLILSNPLNKYFIVKILSNKGSADGEYLC